MGLEHLSACILCESPGISWPDRDFNVCACEKCGLVFENPRPDPGSIVEFYSRPMQYDGWLKESQARQALWKRRLAKMRPHIRPGSLLDIGTGIGQFLDVAKPGFTRVAGTEVSASAIGIAKRKYGLDLMQGDAEALDFRGETFDNITIFHVLEHVGSPRRLIEKCRGLLNPGGALFIAVPNDIASAGAVKRRLQSSLSPAGRRARSAVGLPRLTLDGSMDEIHLSHFTHPVLTRFLSGNGFQVLESSLDPFYAAAGLNLIKMGFLYRTFSLLRAITGVNLYGTIWICARRT